MGEGDFGGQSLDSRLLEMATVEFIRASIDHLAQP